MLLLKMKIISTPPAIIEASTTLRKTLEQGNPVPGGVVQEGARPQRRARGEAGQCEVLFSTVDAEGERASICVPQHPDHCALAVSGGVQDMRVVLAPGPGGRQGNRRGKVRSDRCICRTDCCQQTSDRAFRLQGRVPSRSSPPRRRPRW